MPISGISGLSSMYDIYSVYGNPTSMNKVSAINDDTRSNPALVIAKEQEDKVQQLSDSQPASATAVGDFADILKTQESIQANQIQPAAASSQTNLQNVMDYMMSQSSYNISNIAMAQ